MSAVTKVTTVKEARLLFLIRLQLDEPDEKLDDVIEMFAQSQCKKQREACAVKYSAKGIFQKDTDTKVMAIIRETPLVI